MIPNIKHLFSASLFLLLFAPFLTAQYHLGEIGVNVGAGAAIPLTSWEGMSPGLGWNADAFYSHWVCGKNYGYHGSLGVKSLTFSSDESASLAGAFPDLQSGNRNFTYLVAGGYFKLRKNEFHRRQEIALLAGAKFHYLIAAPYKTGPSGGDLRDLDAIGVSTTNFIPAISVAAWIKRKAGKQSLYLSPGVDWMIFNLASHAQGNLGGLYAHLSIAYTIWNSKQSRFKK